MGLRTVFSAVSFTLPDDEDNLVLIGNANIDGTGNFLDNQIYGNSGNNILDGLAGVDLLAGREGDDTYIVDNISDAVLENPGEGVDTVKSSVDFRLPDNVENLILTGLTDNLQGYGNALDNVLDGSALNNLLDGGIGADIMRGHGGNDVYAVDNTGDQVIELAGEGTRDTVFATIDYTLPDNVEILVMTLNPNVYPLGTSTIGNGNDLDNIIFGNVVANTIHGNNGNDIVQAAAGNDKVFGDAGNDIVNGQDGLDEVHGGTGKDIVNGGAQNDLLWGDSGFDSFRFDAKDGVYGLTDTVKDFEGACKKDGDTLDFYGYGTASHGAKLVEIGHTDQWKIILGSDHDAGAPVGQIITVSGVFNLNAGSDYLFHV